METRIHTTQLTINYGSGSKPQQQKILQKKMMGHEPVSAGGDSSEARGPGL
jgi:hypothetical protein